VDHGIPSYAVKPSLGPDWMQPEWLLSTFGSAMFWVSCAIIFVECGLFFPILPGDSLLFAIGMFIKMHANGQAGIPMNIALACLVLSTVAFAGNVVGYEIGRAMGPALYRRNGRFTKKEYFDKTHEFFDKHGNKALVLGRFVPIVRTYITIVAGVGGMERRRFFTWSAVGALLWATGLTLLGYFLGGIAFLQKNIEYAVVLIVAISVLPMVFEWWRHRSASRREAAGR